ncbi:MAG: hypothetical protein MJ089_02270 [Ruminococcus sp.]|nr:hypothetical protein [Ruminococcus sp.]
MTYSRLKFQQYFIDTSQDYNNTGKARIKINYRSLKYECNGLEKLLHFSHEVNYEIHFEQDRNVIQINFQQTNGNSDWFANIAEFSSRYYDAIDYKGKKLKLRVHHGWGEMYRSIKNIVREEWLYFHNNHPDAATEIVGWSLGSGQAILCCQDLNYNFNVKPYLYTYGSVRPFKYTIFNKRLMKDYLSSISTEAWNFANVNDIVTYMPPFRGFTMINRVNVGKDKITLKRLFDPYHYHTIYDREELYDIPQIK